MTQFNKKVHIEYCGGWGYAGRAAALAKDITTQVDNVQVTRRIGRSRSFEVSCDGVVIFSKLKVHGFPVSGLDFNF